MITQAGRMQEFLHDIAGRRVLFAMAAFPEYGPHLQQRIKPLMIGIGPVEAGVNIAAALTMLHHAGCLPDLVVTLGSAGSRSLEQAGIYQVASVSYRDMDCSPLGFERGITPYLDMPAVIDMPHRIPDVQTARLSTGAGIVSGAAYDAIDADMVDMETFAILRACQKFNVPLIGLRGISDGKAELQKLSDWTEYLHVIDEKLAVVIDRLGDALRDGAINLDRG